MRILAGDIGGTKVLLQLAEAADGRIEPIAEQRFESAAYDGLLPIAEAFLRSVGGPPPAAACFGIAGPINTSTDGQTARVTNLPWEIESRGLAQALEIPRVRLINDFQAVAYAIEILPPDALVTLQAGDPEPAGTRAALGAGTGLGQALLVPIGERYEAIATEGGHVDFAPADDLQIELLQYLRRRYPRVSYERVLSGPGLVNIYGFITGRRGVPGELLTAEDPAAAISAAALDRRDPDAVAALDLFLSIYGAQAGNVALSYFALGGVYVAGGIAPKILPAFGDSAFMRAFLDKGRMRALLERIPVHVITDARAGLKGAALAASRLLS
ncbi:MAG TPA: glucokinase [Burkholderiales bacterium]